MKGISLFRRKDEYEDFVWTEIFKEPLIKLNPFYRSLIQFVMDAKAFVLIALTTMGRQRRDDPTDLGHYLT